ncbi:SDR family NAD(P)-dependent oxidoreductase [Algoriphagus taiwanensis]|uniref:SDR family oxidoreductase n=1 Tax=Algoriphagus taiwanensis TaxID=1445656 RepID=A0ABQ6PVP2_9BACT|nr:SDR family oxidoreductase [Algoriphagus taiwanensis]
MKAFDQARIILTGAGSGIGLALLRQLYPHTRQILAVDFNPIFLDQLRLEFPDLGGILQADLSLKEGNQGILDWVKNHWDGVDFCFANAGKAEYGLAEKQDWENMDRIFQLNIFSPIQLGFQLRNQFPDTQLRHVITCSAIAFWAVPGYSIYGATKSALLQWARGLWAEKDGDWLTLVFPISTSTRFFETAGKDIPKAFPMQSPETVAGKILKGSGMGKKKIFPSPLFRIMLHLNNFLYLIRPGYQLAEYQKLKSWISKPS